MISKITQTEYLHAIYLNDRLKCENIFSSGQLHSLMTTSIYLHGPRSDYYTLPLDELKNKPGEIFKGLVNPRSGALIEADIIRRGQHLVKFGRNVTEQYQKHILKVADAELAFESHRRELDPKRQLPSRLTCLFICEDDDRGANNIRSMLNETKGILICRVRVEVIPMGYHQADFRWFNAYYKQPLQKYIENYWAGKPYDDSRVWECLLEGTITFCQEDIDNVRLYGNFG
ncbi:hypothetical protein [Pedobacter gandavensis]|uniref:hypothetical protein n=1 Tax=Pedobacter gandavensis TaxID=2679963 RepID=UPI0029303469|nr:hypothetical protein [Pedobacter gandavensis]